MTIAILRPIWYNDNALSELGADRPVGQEVKTSPSHGENMGSIPVRVTKKDASEEASFCFFSESGRKERSSSMYFTSVKKQLRAIGKETVRFFYPLECLSCGERLSSLENALCPVCAGRFAEERMTLCKRCEKEHDQCRCPVEGIPQMHLAPYHEALTKKLILTAKDHDYADLTTYMSRALADRIEREERPSENTVVCYVPRAPEKVRDTGVDQSRSLASALAETLGLPLVGPLRRNRAEGVLFFRSPTEQKLLSPYERKLAADRTYRLHPHANAMVAGKRVYLVDDVITTGATVAACASLLKSAGAASVVAISVAKS